MQYLSSKQSFLTVVSLSGPITHRFFPGSFSSCNLFRRSLILFNYDVSMKFISHIPSPRPIWIHSHIWLNLAFFFIPESLIILGAVSRHYSQLANSKECFSQILLHSCEDCHLSFVLSSQLFLSWVIPFFLSGAFLSCFHSRSSEGHHFRRFFVLSFQLSSSILRNCFLFVRLSIIRCLDLVLSQVAYDLFIRMYLH